ncbi:hypothetical protein PAXRUDRAFT_146584, partial [Paxillus rubicundulus Ve08.2h10]
ISKSVLEHNKSCQLWYMFNIGSECDHKQLVFVEKSAFDGHTPCRQCGWVLREKVCCHMIPFQCSLLRLFVPSLLGAEQQMQLLFSLYLAVLWLLPLSSFLFSTFILFLFSIGKIKSVSELIDTREWYWLGADNRYWGCKG